MPIAQKAPIPADLAALDAFYAARGAALPVGHPDGIPASASDHRCEIGKADDWARQPLPSNFRRPESTPRRLTIAVAEIKLQLAVLKYARFARGGRVSPSSLSNILDLDPPIRDPKIVLAEISVSPDPAVISSRCIRSTRQFQNLRQAIVKARGGDGASKPASGKRDIQKIVINMERWRWMPEESRQYLRSGQRA
jgi:murein L,D-transpeptidase YcbB/YkuD